MRRRWWQIHSWLGLIAGLGLLVIGVTGSLLVFHEELERFIHPEWVDVTPTAQGRLAQDALLREAERQLPGYEVTGWLIQREDPTVADVVYVIRHGTSEWLVSTIDPYTGRVLASPRDGKETVTGWLLDLHYTFFADHVGMIVVALLGVMLLVLGVSGLWIYGTFWKNLFTLRWGRGLRILFSDWHRFLGITSVAFNLVLGFTGAYWNILHVGGHLLHGDPEPAKIEKRLYADSLSLDRLMADAARHIPDFSTGYISLPFDPAAPLVTLWGSHEPRGLLRGPYGSTAAYDAATGEYKSHADIREAGVWAQIVDSFTPLHFGTFGGLPIKILYALGGLTPGALAVTGFAIWWLRRRKSRIAEG